MNDMNQKTMARTAAVTAIAGALFMVAGAAVMFSSGADLEAALVAGTMADFLPAAAAARPALVVNLTFWIVGVLLLGATGGAMASLSAARPVPAGLARHAFRVAVPLAIVAFMAMLTVVVQVAPDTSPAAVQLAETLGWFGSRADWTATVLIVAIGPALLAVAGRGIWLPTWLARAAVLPLVGGVLTTVAMYTNSLTTYGMAIIPLGLLWLLAAGVAAWRFAAGAAQVESASVPGAGSLPRAASS